MPKPTALRQTLWQAFRMLMQREGTAHALQASEAAGVQQRQKTCMLGLTWPSARRSASGARSSSVASTASNALAGVIAPQ